MTDVRRPTWTQRVLVRVLLVVAVAAGLCAMHVFAAALSQHHSTTHEVMAHDSAGAATATTPVASAKVTITTGRWKNADTRIQGTTDQPALTSSVVRFYRKAADGTYTIQYAGPAALVAAVAPATGSTFDGRFRTTALTGTTNPGQIVAKLFDASGKELGASAPFTLTNG